MLPTSPVEGTCSSPTTGCGPRPPTTTWWSGWPFRGHDPDMPEEYVLGHRAEELARLDHQAKALEPATRLALQLAGITSGMRVLDLGTGTGEVALLAAEAVGPTGSVVGVDQSPDVLEYAAGKCRARGVTNVRFERADIATYVPDEPVD